MPFAGAGGTHGVIDAGIEVDPSRVARLATVHGYDVDPVVLPAGAWEPGALAGRLSGYG